MSNSRALLPKSKKKAAPAKIPQPSGRKGVEGSEEDEGEEDPSDTEEAYERTARLQCVRHLAIQMYHLCRVTVHSPSGSQLDYINV